MPSPISPGTGYQSQTLLSDWRLASKRLPACIVRDESMNNAQRSLPMYGFHQRHFCVLEIVPSLLCWPVVRGTKDVAMGLSEGSAVG
jgi:hypothetical protein